jgi:hypothetical protein
MDRRTTAVIAALLLGAGGVGTGTAALIKKPALQSPEVAALRTELSTDRVRLENAATSAGTQEAKVTKLLSCIPELLAQLNGLTPEWSGSSIWLAQHAQLSSYCSPILEAHS